jgi:hypothetical protein
VQTITFAAELINKRKNMRKLLFLLFISIMSFCPFTSVMADDFEESEETEEIDFEVSFVEQNPTAPNNPKAPIRIPHVYKCNYTLTFEGVHPEYTLYIMKDGVVEYFTEVLSSMQTVQLPILSAGIYEVYLVLGNYVFKGTISFNS